MKTVSCTTNQGTGGWGYYAFAGVAYVDRVFKKEERITGSPPGTEIRTGAFFIVELCIYLLSKFINVAG